MGCTILIAEDDEKIGRLLCDILKKQGYTPLWAKDGQKALDYFFDRQEIVLCLLDVMMPVYSGYDVLETIREHSQVPVIMLTALGEESDELQGFRAGVDDYIAKPFSYGVLLARIENLLKKQLKFQDKLVEKGRLQVDFKGYRVWVDQEEIVLNNKEFALFTLLLEHENQVLTREQMLGKVWGYDYEGEIRTVDTHIKMLRKKLVDCGEYITTVRGVGYKFQVTTT